MFQILNLCIPIPTPAILFSQKKKKERKTTASAFAVILACVGVLSGIAAKSRKVLAAAHCIGDYLEASQGQSQTLANCHRCNCFEKQVSSPLTSCRKMKMGKQTLQQKIWDKSKSNLISLPSNFVLRTGFWCQTVLT